MSTADNIKEEVKTGLKLLAFKSVSLEIAPMAIVEEAMQEGDWHAVSAIKGNGIDTDYRRFYYSTAMKSYAQISCSGYRGNCTIEPVEERDVLDALDFKEMKVLSGMIDKKSVAFIALYAQKERESVKTPEELEALNKRNASMIEEAEAALRKR